MKKTQKIVKSNIESQTSSHKQFSLKWFLPIKNKLKRKKVPTNIEMNETDNIIALSSSSMFLKIVTNSSSNKSSS